MTMTFEGSPAKPLVNEGAIRLSQGDVESAERLFREAIDLDPVNATAHTNLGYVLACGGHHDEAIAEGERSVSLDPRRSAPWAHLGMSYVATGRIDDGLDALAQAVRLDPENHFAWDAMGRTFLALGRVDEAEIAWASALAARPDDPDLMISLATVLAATDRTTEALRLLHRLVSIEPTFVRGWVQLGTLALVRQDHGTAGEALLTALDLDPANEEARYHLALLHVVVGAIDEARQALAELVAADGSWAEESASLLEQLHESA